MSTPLKAITVCQPYAELIARLEKRVENRHHWTAAEQLKDKEGE